jgi:indole-3-acetate monooxygenase
MEKLFAAAEHIGGILTATIDNDEQKGRLSQPVITALANEGFYKLFMPSSLGGLETDPLTVAKLVEKIARYNAAAAWSIMVTNTANWFYKYLPEDALKDMNVLNGKSFCAGTFAAPVMAEKTDGGFMVRGQVPLCSNVHEAGWIMLLAMVMQDGAPVMHNGIPEIRGVALKKEDCHIVDTWQVFGMKATDSNDIAVTNSFVPYYRCYALAPNPEVSEHYKGALYRFPLTGIISCSLIVPTALAIATNAINELKLLIAKVPAGSSVSLKEKTSFQRKLAMAEAMVGSARAYLHQSLTSCWNKVESGDPASVEDRSLLLLTGSYVNHSCVNAVDMVLPMKTVLKRQHNCSLVCLLIFFQQCYRLQVTRRKFVLQADRCRTITNMITFVSRPVLATKTIERGSLIRFLLFLSFRRFCDLIIFQCKINPILQFLFGIQSANIDKNIPLHNFARKIHWLAAFLFYRFLILCRIETNHQTFLFHSNTHFIVDHKTKSAEHSFLYNPHIG